MRSVNMKGGFLLQNQPAKYDTAQKGPLDKTGPAQSMADMGTRRGQ